MRRNTFWIGEFSCSSYDRSVLNTVLAYMTERHFTAINSFATFLDDEDVSQMLPVRGDQFEQGVSVSRIPGRLRLKNTQILVPPQDRQWSHNFHVIETQDEDQVDPFILHVKATMLLSKIKFFNCRYKTKRHRGDPDYQPDPNGIPGIPRADLITTTRAFKDLDELIVSFRQSFPPHLKDPVAHGTIDGTLLTALSCSH